MDRRAAGRDFLSDKILPDFNFRIGVNFPVNFG